MRRNFNLVGLLFLAFIILSGLKSDTLTESPLEERSRCNQYIDVKTDTITGRVRLMAKDKMKLLDKDGKMVLDMMMIRHDKEITLHFKSIKPACFGRNTMVMFEFSDDSTAQIKSSNDKNCRGVISVNMGGIFGDKGIMKKLSSSTIRNIKFSTVDQAIQIDLNIDQKERILNTLDCFIYS